MQLLAPAQAELAAKAEPELAEREPVGLLLVIPPGMMRSVATLKAA